MMMVVVVVKEEQGRIKYKQKGEAGKQAGRQRLRRDIFIYLF